MYLLSHGGLPVNCTSALQEFTIMGSLCSKPGTHSGGHTVLGSSSSTSPGGAVPPTSDARAAAAAAAEQRLLAVSLILTSTSICCNSNIHLKAQRRGTSAANPNQGRLAAKIGQPIRTEPQQEEERLVVSTIRGMTRCDI